MTAQSTAYQLPPLDLLDCALPSESKEELLANARLLQQSLAQFGIEVALGDITKGPSITRFEFHVAPGVRMQRIQGLSNNLMAALQATSIRILAPIPGKSTVGVELPNLVKTQVVIRALLESEEWRNSPACLPIALGKEVSGHPIIVDLADMPHLLIAGSTGSGKSVCLNAIIISLLYRFSPDQLRLMLIDCKGVEFQQYNTLPHLLAPVMSTAAESLNALQWVVNEMETRYKIFAQVGARDIKSFNDRPTVEHVLGEDEIVIPQKFSYIVVVMDELADLLRETRTEVEKYLARITQVGNAAGIHCIVAVERPSVDVVPGIIKANIPARLSFRLPSKVNSISVFDRSGAEELQANGDFLYLVNSSENYVHGQGALISDRESQKIVDFITRQVNSPANTGVESDIEIAAEGGAEGGIDEDEETVQQCIDIVCVERKASASLLQRTMGFGHTRAARMIEELARRGVIGPSKGAEAREVLFTIESPQVPPIIETEAPLPTTETSITYTCPICAKECSVAQSLTGQNVVCPNCNQEFYASPLDVKSVEPDELAARNRYTLPAKLPFFKSGRKHLLAKHFADLVTREKYDEEGKRELACMAADLGLTQSDLVEVQSGLAKLQRKRADQEFQPIKQRIQSSLMLTDEDEKAIRKLEEKYGIRGLLGEFTKIYRANYIMATKGRLPSPIQTGLMLDESELVYHQIRTTWHQSRVNNYSFAGPSLSIPIVKGLRYRMASYDVARTEAMTPLSKGVLYVTSKRLLFVGESRNTSINLSRVVNFQIFKDALKVEKSTGKPDLFSMDVADAGYITTMIGLLRE